MIEPIGTNSVAQQMMSNVIQFTGCSDMNPGLSTEAFVSLCTFISCILEWNFSMYHISVYIQYTYSIHTVPICIFWEVGTNPFITVTIIYVFFDLTQKVIIISTVLQILWSTVVHHMYGWPGFYKCHHWLRSFCTYIHVGCNHWGWAFTQLYLLHLHSALVSLAHCGGHCGHLQSDKVWEWTFCGERMCTCLWCVWTLTLCRSVYAYVNYLR